VASRPVAVAFASRVHGESYYKELLELFAGALRARGVELLGVATSAGEAELLGKEAAGSVPVALALTGGVSELVRVFAEAGGFKGVAIFGHGEHNSTPSALSARAKLSSAGVKAWLELCEAPASLECREALERLAAAAKAAASLKGSRIGVVGVASKGQSALAFERAFGSEVVAVPWEELELGAGEGFAERLSKLVEAPRGGEAGLRKVGSVYEALKRLAASRGFDAVAVNCFDLAVREGFVPCAALALLNSEGFVAGCEADLPALALMVLAKELDARGGWIANVAYASGCRLFLAHCTASLSLLARPRLVEHFETGSPFAVAGSLPLGAATVASMSPDFSKLAAARAEVLESGLLRPGACRTQAVVEVKDCRGDLLKKLLANHHVLVPGDHRRELEAAAALLGLDFVEYGGCC